MTEEERAAENLRRTDYIGEQRYQHPNLGRFAEVISSFADSQKGRDFLGAKDAIKGYAKALRSLAAGDELVSPYAREASPAGKDVASLGTDAVLSTIPTEAFTGAAGVTMLGKKGLEALASTGLAERFQKWLATEKMLKNFSPKDWLGQKELVEGAGGIAIPHGRRLPSEISSIPDAGVMKPTIEHARPYYNTGNLDRHKLHEVQYGPKDKFEQPITNFFNDPITSKAYPEIDDYTIWHQPNKTPNSASYDFDNRRINMGPTDSPEKAEKLFYHEGNHFVQRQEGWPEGANPEFMFEQIGLMADLRKDLNRQGIALPLELRRQKAFLDKWDDVRLDRKITSEKRKHLQDTMAWEMYMNEAGEQIAESGAQSVRSTYPPHKLQTAHPKEMFDLRRQIDMLRNYGIQ